MHPSLDELLAFRDGEYAPDAARHAARCSRCRVKLEELRQTADALRELPQIEPPESAWRVIGEELQRRRRIHRRWRLAAAAVVLVASLIGASVGLAPRPGGEVVHDPASDAQLHDLIEASKTLELVIRAPGSRTPVLRASEAARIVALEDRIAAIDAALNTAGRDATRSREIALWTGRVELLDELLRVSDSSAAQNGFNQAELEYEGSSP